MLKLTRGLLIAIEGIDGAGKTTQARAIAQRFAAAGLLTRESKEPTGGQWGRLIRQSKTAGRLSPADELEAFLEDRREHVAEVLGPSLRKGAIVIVDRYYYSTAAYQGVRGADPADILRRNEEFAPRPDLLVVLHIDPAVGLERIRARGDQADHFERLDDLQRSAIVFRGFAGPHVLHVDGARPPHEITQAILDAFYAGPLYQAACLRAQIPPECDPWCVLHERCPYIAAGVTSPFDPSTLAPEPRDAARS